MLEKQITLRRVTPDDTHFLEKLFCDTRREELSTWGWTPEQQQGFLRMQFDAQSRSYQATFPSADNHIISVEGDAIGRILVAKGPQELRLIDISLLEEHRNHGMGTDLLRELQQECEKNLLVFQLQVRQGNIAIRLYQRLGFVQSSADSMYVQMEWTPS